MKVVLMRKADSGNQRNAGERRQAAKNLVKCQAATNHDGWRNAGEWN